MSDQKRDEVEKKQNGDMRADCLSKQSFYKYYEDQRVRTIHIYI